MVWRARCPDICLVAGSRVKSKRSTPLSATVRCAVPSVHLTREVRLWRRDWRGIAEIESDLFASVDLW